MKKLLITSTALVLVAGAAVAEVKVGGDARMGVVYNHDYNWNGLFGAASNVDTKSAWNFSSRVRVSFTLSGETDGGLQFGASIRADNAGDGAKGSAGNVWISGEWGKISMGDVVGAAEAALFDLPEIGFTDLGSDATTYWGTSDNDVFFLTGDGGDGLTYDNNPVLLYQYSAGDVNVYLSMSDGSVGQTAAKDAQAYAIGFSYSFGDYSIGAGYEVYDYAARGWDNDEHWIIGGTANFGDTTVNAFYGQYKEGAVRVPPAAPPAFKSWTAAHYGIGVTSKFDAITVNAFIQQHEDDGLNSAGDVSNRTTWGLGAAYDLGGGASIVGGIVDDSSHVAVRDGSVAGWSYESTKPRIDVGVKFKF